MEHRLDTELDRKDEREEPEWCERCDGYGVVPMEGYAWPVVADCDACYGKGVKDEQRTSR